MKQGRIVLKSLILVLFGLLVFHAFAQSFDAERIYNSANRLEVDHYDLDLRYDYLILESSFSNQEIKKIPFTDRRILKIDLVNTSFKEEETFDQRKLDLARISELIDINPLIAEQIFCDWQLVEQTGCNSSESCSPFFHGFVIYYDTYFTKETSKLEIDSINKDLTRFNEQVSKLKDQLKVTYTRIDCVYPEARYSSKYITDKIKRFYSCYDDFKGRVFFEVDIDHEGRPVDVVVKGNLFPCKEDLASAIRKSAQWQRGIVIGHQQYQIKAKGYVSFPLKGESFTILSFEISPDLVQKHKMLQQYAQCVAYDVDTSYTDIIPKVRKKVVSQTLLRNRFSPELFIVDVTGSMYPYTADMLKWLKLTDLPEEKTFVFFNDGNDKVTSQKVVGRTGGIYSIVSKDLMEVRDKMFEAMRAGGGGDLPENNFEALLYGIAKTPINGDVVMIADNHSFPRDHELLAKYGAALKIILCHTEKGINTRYIDLAKKYGFSLHTLKTDLTDLNHRDLIIDGKTYRESVGGYRALR